MVVAVVAFEDVFVVVASVASEEVSVVVASVYVSADVSSEVKSRRRDLRTIVGLDVGVFDERGA